MIALAALFGAALRVRAQPQVAEVEVPQPILKGFEFQPELTLAWPAGSYPPEGAFRASRPFKRSRKPQRFAFPLRPHSHADARESNRECLCVDSAHPGCVCCAQSWLAPAARARAAELACVVDRCRFYLLPLASKLLQLRQTASQT